MKIKIALLDDKTDQSLSRSILLNDGVNFSCVGIWHHPKDILLNLRINMPDILITEVKLQNSQCLIDSLKLIKENFPNLKIFVLSHCSDVETIQKSIGLGINGYLIKGITPIQLFEALNESAKNGFPISPQIAGTLIQLYKTLVQTNYQTTVTRPVINNLPKRQCEILEKIEKGYSYRRIGEELYISIDTVRYHIKNLYEHFDVNTKHALLERIFHFQK